MVIFLLVYCINKKYWITCRLIFSFKLDGAKIQFFAVNFIFPKLTAQHLIVEANETNEIMCKAMNIL